MVLDLGSSLLDSTVLQLLDLMIIIIEDAKVGFHLTPRLERHWSEKFPQRNQYFFHLETLVLQLVGFILIRKHLN